MKMRHFRYSEKLPSDVSNRDVTCEIMHACRLQIFGMYCSNNYEYRFKFLQVIEDYIRQPYVYFMRIYSHPLFVSAADGDDQRTPRGL